MSGVIHSLDWWWQYFRKLFHIKTFYITGSITLGPGQQEVAVQTDVSNPARVFLCVEEPEDAVTTCLGSINWVAARVVENGFLLYADIKTASCEIKYVAEYDEDHDNGNHNGPIVVGGDS